MATRETSLEGTGEFRPIAAGPLAAVALMAFIGMAAVPLSLWRIVRAGLRTGRS